jgi:outer membrane receptor for ferrienterochelin and colicin
MNKIIVLFVCFLIAANVHAQKTDTVTQDYDAMSLEQLLNVKISVASKTELTQRESPGIVSVITHEEIMKMGARDITDILNQIPGFTLGVDVENSIGISARGNWALEGKILILLDGQEMNELLYANTILGQNYDVTQIERIEVIRGPGSSIYGGYAELGVINIVTKQGKDLNGIVAQASYGSVRGATARQNATLAIGKSNEKFEYSVKGYYGKGIRSNENYTDVFGTKINLAKNSSSDPAMVNASFRIKSFNAKFIYDNYSVKTADWYVDINETATVHFNGLYGQLDYKIGKSKKFSVTPQLNVKSGTPWRTSESSSYAPYSITATRLSPKVYMNWQVVDQVNITGGVDSYFDYGKLNYSHDTPDTGYFPNGGSRISYNNIGVFAQGLWKNKIANLTVGARQDTHSQFGGAFSPRVGLTKQIDKFHFKLLVSRAFRAPTIETLRVNPDLKPERTNVREIEIGYQMNENMLITGNIFDITILKTIYYFAVSASDANFNNGEKSGSRGFEIEYRAKFSRGYFNINYATYTMAGKSIIDLYGVPGSTTSVLSAPRGRVNFNSTLKISNKTSLNTTANFLSKRYGYDRTTNLTAFPSSLYVNLFANTEDIFTKGLSAGLGVYNIFNKQFQFIQPYNGGHAPLPGLTREVMLRISYKIPFNGK